MTPILYLRAKAFLVYLLPCNLQQMAHGRRAGGGYFRNVEVAAQHPSFSLIVGFICRVKEHRKNGKCMVTNACLADT